MILKQDLIPIQDDRENVKRRGVRRPDANAHAERRIADRGTDSTVSHEQRNDRIQRPESAELYGWVERVLVAQEYATRGKKQRGAVRAYIVKMTGLSLPQATRLIRQYRADGVVEAAPYRRRRFPVKYTSQDVARLAEVDRAHGWLSGPATVRIFQREHQQFGKAEYARLGEISVAHLYNLRGSDRYRKLAAKWEPTRPTATLIGERRQPNPRGQPGYLRIDTVHQGD